MRRLLMIIALCSFTLGLAACNTMEGVGQDVKAGGEKLEEEADERK